MAVDGGQDFVAAGAGEVPGMTAVGREPVEAFLVDAVQQFVDPLGNARPVVEEVADAVQRVGDGLAWAAWCRWAGRWLVGPAVRWLEAR